MVIVIVLPTPSSWPGYWPLALPLVAVLLRASRGSVLHRVHYHIRPDRRGPLDQQPLILLLLGGGQR
ncbi:hypothetical protein AB0R12_23700, partial [Streptomyces niveus]|uniref:hypothetical protein n=1 Tax=Streptomyces niveus TaxID=193462 RepID=UPI003431B42F